MAEQKGLTFKVQNLIYIEDPILGKACGVKQENCSDYTKGMMIEPRDNDPDNFEMLRKQLSDALDKP